MLEFFLLIALVVIFAFPLGEISIRRDAISQNEK